MARDRASPQPPPSPERGEISEGHKRVASDLRIIAKTADSRDLFEIQPGGRLIELSDMHGYVILPTEEYDRLLVAASETAKGDLLIGAK